MRWLYTITNLSRLKNFTHLNASRIELLNRTEEHFCQWVEVPKLWNTFEIFDYLLTGPLLTLVLIVGLFGGYFCLATFWLGCKNLRIYIYLLVLAVWDVLYLLTAFYLYNLPVYIYQEIVHFGPLIIFQPYIYYLSAVARTGCIWSVLVIAVERYLALCHPFKFQSWSGTGSHQQQRLTTIFCSMVLGMVISCCSSKLFSQCHRCQLKFNEYFRG
uniref:G-protein coupled receptors family 1 profile domain-containing protein n=1 Tax=Romanomermis culicivorax TaxID=13658 RepID=A0A915K1W9_ROMCU